MELRHLADDQDVMLIPLFTYAALAPRLGLAFSPGQSRRIVFRGGGGVFLDRAP